MAWAATAGLAVAGSWLGAAAASLAPRPPAPPPPPPAYGYYGGYGYAPAYGSGYAPCPRVFAGYRNYWDGYGWVRKPVYRRDCGYGY